MVVHMQHNRCDSKKIMTASLALLAVAMLSFGAVAALGSNDANAIDVADVDETSIEASSATFLANGDPIDGRYNQSDITNIIIIFIIIIIIAAIVGILITRKK